jgi:hypothetical protein
MPPPAAPGVVLPFTNLALIVAVPPLATPPAPAFGPPSEVLPSTWLRLRVRMLAPMPPIPVPLATPPPPLAGVNPKNLMLAAAAGAGAAELGLWSTDAIVSLIVFVIVASLTIAGPLV